ncbi:hypothetical protein [Streptomyces chartreusis]|uniref:hypothetical protein n=1 Tax=Streptomyces chartreusis TaxID=1969 RepID=UPI00365A5B78
MTIDSYSAIAGAVGTVAAVIVALYLSVWRDDRWRAELKVLDFDAARLGDQVEISEPDRKSLWVRLSVVNAPRRRTAHDVEVALETVEALGEDLPEELVRGIAGAAGRQLKWADRSDGTLSIHPGAVRRFDLFHVVTGGDRDCCRFTFRDLGQGDDGHPLGWQCVLPVGSYRVNLSIEAADLDTRQFCCVITWRGGFDLEVSPVTRVV